MGNMCQQNDQMVRNSEDSQKDKIEELPEVSAIKDKIKRNRAEEEAFPIVNANVQQKIKNYTKYESKVKHLKVWKMKPPVNIYYANLNDPQDIPIGDCIVYKMKDNGDFMGYYQGNITEAGMPQLKNSLFVFYNGSYLLGIDDNKAKYCNENTKLTYEGGWENEMPQNEGVEQNNKGIYSGSFNKGEKQGFGKFIWHDGSVYEGNFSKGLFSGEGKLTDSSNSYEYEGKFVNGEKHGKGVQKNNDEVYQGQFKQGFRSGYGKLQIYASEIHPIRVYEGQFDDNVPHGKGLFTENDAKVTGVWQKGALRVII